MLNPTVKVKLKEIEKIKCGKNTNWNLHTKALGFKK